MHLNFPSIMVGQKFGIYSSQLAKNAAKFSTMVGENFGIYSFQLAKNALKFQPWSAMIGEIILNFCTKTHK